MMLLKRRAAYNACRWQPVVASLYRGGGGTDLFDSGCQQGAGNGFCVGATVLPPGCPAWAVGWARAVARRARQHCAAPGEGQGLTARCGSSSAGHEVSLLCAHKGAGRGWPRVAEDRLEDIPGREAAWGGPKMSCLRVTEWSGQKSCTLRSEGLFCPSGPGGGGVVVGGHRWPTLFSIKPRDSNCFLARVATYGHP